MRIQNHRPLTRAEPTSAPTSKVKPQKVAIPRANGTEVAQPSPTEVRNTENAKRFFEVFGRQDFAAIEAWYRPDATFRDPMFDHGSRQSIMGMWNRAPTFSKFKSEFVEAKGDEVKYRWSVDYVMFGHPVHNEIESTLKFDNEGKIASQTEFWDRSKWMSQAVPIIPKFLQPLAFNIAKPLIRLFGD